MITFQIITVGQSQISGFGSDLRSAIRYKWPYYISQLGEAILRQKSSIGKRSSIATMSDCMRTTNQEKMKLRSQVDRLAHSLH